MDKKQFRDEDLSHLFYKNNVIEIDSCVCCGGRDINLWCRTQTFSAFQCGNCGFVFMNPQLDINGLNDYYNNYLGKRRINNSKKMEQRTIQYEQDAQVLFDRGFTGGKLLDVGCNGGFFLSTLGNQFDRYGTEIDPEAVEFCKINVSDFSGNIFNGVLEDANFGDSFFDVVTMRGVIEHVPNPTATLSEVARILKPGGILFICATPNVDSVAADYYRENWSLFHPVQHLWHFSPKTLSRLASKYNFRLEWQELPYIGTPYEDFLSDLTKFASDIESSNAIAAKEIVSPPFFGSMMSLIFRKVDK